MNMKTRKSIEFEESSGNVFADLGLKDSDRRPRFQNPKREEVEAA
jgi:hypothetical protein